MLEKLGETIRKATDKIANAIFLDKNLMDIIIRDLQRALIEADVSISLIKEISDKIRKTAQDERIKGIDKKEHVIKILHDELLRILGEHKELKLQKKQNRIMLLGLYGCGKCVHAETNIQLKDGDIITAEDLYRKYNKEFNQEILEDGKIINIKNKNLVVPSFNSKNLKIENKKVTHLWKLKKEELIEIKLNNGNDYSIKVTPEHPFFVLKNGQVVKLRADELTEDDFISVPNKIEIQGKTINLFDQIKDFDLYVYLSPEEAKQEILRKYYNIKDMHKNLKFKKNYCQLTSDIKKGKIPIELIEKEKNNFLKIKSYKSTKTISLPLFLTQEFAEFIGYVMGDGYISKRYIGIASENPEVIKRVIELSKILFNIIPTITKDKRTKNLHQIRINSKTLVEIFKIFGLTPGKKGKNLKISKQIRLSNNEVIRAFIKAYFDCDSYPSKNRNIELTSESDILIKQMSLLLKRLGILSTISKKKINEVSYWTLKIKARYAEIYSEKIGYLIKNKQEKVEDYKRIGEIQGAGNQDMIPLGKTLRALRLILGFSIGEIQENAVYSYGTYERKGIISKEHLRKLVLYYKLRKKGFFLNILEDISKGNFKNKYSHCIINGVLKHLKKEEFIEIKNKKIKISERGNQYIQLIQKNNPQELLNNFEKLSLSNICWLSIREINKTKNNKEFVYDLTVKDNHSFIAEGIIAHNTTTIAKLGNYYAKRGNKVALLGLDVHRPAAKEQLKQISEKNNLSCFVDIENEKLGAVETWKKFKPKLKSYDLVLIDTAGRHTLDKELIKEIKKLKKEIKPTETILVLPADIGQAAKTQASQFHEAIDISGVIITRMDSSAKGGGALTACVETKANVYFIGTGEKINDLEKFDSESFLSRLLGMGDLPSLIEKIKSVTDKNSEKKIRKNLEEGKLSLEDVIEQVKSLNSLGGFEKIKGMIPGFSKIEGKISEEKLESQQGKISKWEHIIKSMTKEEKENPEILEKQTSRINRIAKGSGVANSDVRALIKQYKMLNSLIKDGLEEKGDLSGGLSQKQMMKFAKKFGKKSFRGF